MNLRIQNTFAGRGISQTNTARKRLQLIDSSADYVDTCLFHIFSHKNNINEEIREDIYTKKFIKASLALLTSFFFASEIIVLRIYHARP